MLSAIFVPCMEAHGYRQDASRFAPDTPRKDAMI